MPQTPIQNNFGVLPDVAQTPRVSAESFGAGTWKMMGENANTMVKGAEALENIQYYTGRTAAREVINDYRIKLDDLKNQITSNPENYRDWGTQYLKQQEFTQISVEVTVTINDKIKKNASQYFVVHNANTENKINQISTVEQHTVQTNT